MTALFTKAKKEKLVAIFDIGSGSVGGAMTLMTESSSGIPTIIGSTRTEITFHNELDFNVFLEDMIVALGKTAESLYNLKLGAPDEIVCVLASPWYLSESRIIKIERTTPFVFSKSFADDLIQKEMGVLLSLYNKKYAEAKSTPKLIENQITSVYLNGYQVDDPINKKIKKIEMNMVISLAPEICLTRIQETLTRTFHHTPVKFSAFINLVYIAVRDRYNDANPYLIMDIGGEVTDIAIVSRDIVKTSLSFPFGRQTFYRFLNKKLNKNLNETQSLFSMYSGGVLDKIEKDKLEPVLDSIKKSWSDAFRESIANLPNMALSLPNTVFLVADSDILSWFAEIIRNSEYMSSMIGGQKCTVITLSGSEFLTVCNVKNTTCDPFLMIESISTLRKQPARP